MEKMDSSIAPQPEQVSEIVEKKILEMLQGAHKKEEWLDFINDLAGEVILGGLEGVADGEEIAYEKFEDKARRTECLNVVALRKVFDLIKRVREGLAEN